MNHYGLLLGRSANALEEEAVLPVSRQNSLGENGQDVRDTHANGSALLRRTQRGGTGRHEKEESGRRSLLTWPNILALFAVLVALR